MVTASPVCPWVMDLAHCPACPGLLTGLLLRTAGIYHFPLKEEITTGIGSFLTNTNLSGATCRYTAAAVVGLTNVGRYMISHCVQPLKRFGQERIFG